MKHDAGIRIIATFNDHAVPLVEGDAPAGAGSRSRNEGVTMLPTLDSQSQPLPSQQPESEIAALVARIEAALEVIHAALAQIKRLQNPPHNPPQSKAG
jgi:hypothetical protein